MNVLQGTLDMLVLKALAEEARHGYGVVEWVRRTTGGELELEDGALYHALHRMHKRGWLSAEWGVSDSNRRAKYYSVTASGRARLAKATSEWDRYAAAVSRILESDPAA